MKTEDKLNVLIGIMALGRYQVWWWTNYKTQAAQAEFKRLWSPVLSGLDVWQIRDGMKKWQQDHDDDYPPTPELFADAIRPKHTNTSIRSFADIKASLNA